MSPERLFFFSNSIPCYKTESSQTNDSLDYLVTKLKILEAKSEKNLKFQKILKLDIH